MSDTLPFTPFRLTCRSGVRYFDRPAVMGILNITEDSFYDGGRHTTPESILSHARSLLAEGADIIDIGAVSSRPGAQLLKPKEEADRLVPVIRLLRRELPKETILSVDTCFSLPATESFNAGADLINDISGGQMDTLMLPLIDAMSIPYVLMHMRGTPATMQNPENTQYGDIVDDLVRYYEERLSHFTNPDSCDIFLDPGFGFAKTLEQNHELLHRLSELIGRLPEYPFLVGISNKSMITRRLATLTLPPENPSMPDSELGTLALDTFALCAGASILRVHSPRPTRIAIDLLYTQQ